MNESFSRVHQSLYIYYIHTYIWKVPDFKCDLSVLNTKGRFYYPFVNIIHCGSSLHFQSPPFFGIISSKGRLCWVCILFFLSYMVYTRHLHFYHISRFPIHSILRSLVSLIWLTIYLGIIVRSRYFFYKYNIICKLYLYSSYIMLYAMIII